MRNKESGQKGASVPKYGIDLKGIGDVSGVGSVFRGRYVDTVPGRIRSAEIGRELAEGIDEAFKNAEAGDLVKGPSKKDSIELNKATVEYTQALSTALGKEDSAKLAEYKKRGDFGGEAQIFFKKVEDLIESDPELSRLREVYFTELSKVV